VSATLEEIIWAVVVDHYIATAPQPPTRQGLAVFANYHMDRLRSPGVMRNARDAASQCRTLWVENASLLQQRLRRKRWSISTSNRLDHTPRSRTRQAPLRKP
jgi:hypothetical protein